MCVALRQFRAHYETRWKPRAFVTFPTRGRFFGTKRPWTTQDSQAASGSRILTSCMPRSNMFRTTDTPRIMKVCTTNPATNTLALYPNTGVGTEPASGTKVGLYTPEKKKKNKQCCQTHLSAPHPGEMTTCVSNRQAKVPKMLRQGFRFHLPSYPSPDASVPDIKE